MSGKELQVIFEQIEKRLVDISEQSQKAIDQAQSALAMVQETLRVVLALKKKTLSKAETEVIQVLKQPKDTT